MDQYSYTNADAVLRPPKLGIPFDLLDEYEPHDTIYTITVFCPPCPPPKYLLKRFIRDENPQDKPNYDRFRASDLNTMKTKVVKIKASYFNLDMRCKHVREGEERKCEAGCYVLEKGGIPRWWTCGRKDCKGHIYDEKNVKRDEYGQACFGKKGERIVCVAK